MTATSTAHLPTTFRLRAAGESFPSILRDLASAGYNVDRYTGVGGGGPNLLNHDLRAYCRRLGVEVPGATTRPRRVRSGARRFGVEIEVVGLSQATAAAALRAAGLLAEVERYNHSTRSHWKVVTDATVRGCEVVSPPMTDWADVATAMAALRGAGGTVDRTTGLHVHHEVADLDGASLARLVRMYADHSDELDGLVATYRRAGRGQYCGRLSAGHADRLAAVLEGCTGTTLAARQAQARGVTAVSRYVTLNCHSYLTYGTVEFRQHQGTLSGAKGQAWLLLGQAMIRAAVEARTFPTGGLVDGLASSGCLADEPATFLRRRASVLAS
jgi:hypothetical protein